MFGRKPKKPERRSFIQNIVRSSIEKSIESFADSEESTEEKNPINLNHNLTQEQLMKFPSNLRWRPWKITPEQREYYLRTDEEI